MNEESVLLTTEGTWVWDGSSWEQRFPDMSPPARQHYGMAFDRSRGVVIMSGRRGDSPVDAAEPAAVARSDTWSWDGTNWTKLSGVHGRHRFNGAMSSYGDEVMVFGGRAKIEKSTTWVLGPDRWERLDVETMPSARVGLVMEYDSARERVVQFGGVGGGGADRFYAQTWALQR